MALQSSAAELEVEWAFGTGGKSDGLATSVAPDGSGGCYIGGMFQGELTLAGTTATSSGGHDAYAARVDGEGKGLWAHASGGEGTVIGGDDHDLSCSIAADDRGTVVISGAFRNATKMGKMELRSRKGNDIFLTRYRVK